MFFYNFNELDNFIKNNLINNLTQEKNNLENIINLYDNKQNELSNLITNMIEMSYSIDKSKLDNFYNTINLLKKSFDMMNDIENLSLKLNKDIDYTIELYDKSLEDNENEIKANLVEYNKQRDELFNKILEFESINTSIINSTISLFFNKKDKDSKDQNKKNINKEINIKINNNLNQDDRNILTVSEKEQKAYLPFFYKDVKEIYQKYSDKYKTMKDVIDDLYVIPLDRFKNSSISRFRESFNLIRNKEHGSITKALDLGLELMFKYELNPIIICACRNLDELDIYLDCLEENELYDFKCFDINFEIMPKISKNTKKDTF